MRKKLVVDGIHEGEFWEHEAGYHNYSDKACGKAIQDKLYNVGLKISMDLFVYGGHMRLSDRVLDLGWG